MGGRRRRPTSCCSTSSRSGTRASSGALARRVARRKPILALKAGTTAAGARAASSHTAALAGSEAAVDALFRQAGVLRARTLEELVDAAALLSSQPLPARPPRRRAHERRRARDPLRRRLRGRGPRAARPLRGDARRARRGAARARRASRNPVDLLGSATAATYERGAAAAARRPARRRADRALRPAGRRRRATRSRPRSGATRRGGRDREAGARRRDERRRHAGRAAPSARASPRSRIRSRPPARSGSRPSAPNGCAGPPAPSPSSTGSTARPRARGRRARADERAWLDAGRRRGRCSSAYGIPLVPERDRRRRRRGGRRGATSSASRSSSRRRPRARTRPRRGGVALDLRDEEQVRAAVERIGGAGDRPAATSSGGAELLAGVVQDPVFGPLVAFGPGGVFAELIGDAAFRIAPLTDVDAEELVARRQGRPARRAASAASRQPTPRRSPTSSTGSARLAEDLPEVAELDLNPVIAGPDGCVAVDARVRLRSRPVERALKSW